MEHGSLKRGLLIIPKREVHGNTIYDATSTLSVTVYFDAIRSENKNSLPPVFGLRNLFQCAERLHLIYDQVTRSFTPV
jgi:hypothetical protein